MNKLEKLTRDLQEEQVSRASLFWLRVFAQNAKDGILRSDDWVEIGLREGAAILGLDETDSLPRLTLLTKYDLFQLARLKDQKVFSGREIEAVNWRQKYQVSLLPDVWEQGNFLEDWVEPLWQQMGAVSPQDQILEKLLKNKNTLWGEGIPNRSLLPEILHEAQAIYQGWLPRPVLNRIAQALKLPLADVYGVTEFFTMYYTAPVGKKIIRICEDTACAIRGSQVVQAALCRRLGIQPGEITADGEYSIEPIRCLGLCDHAPAALVNSTRHFEISSETVDVLLENTPLHPQWHNKVGGLAKIALANINSIDPRNLADYQAQGGFSALQKVLQGFTPTQVIETVKASQLVGRGGAAFPTGLKWQYTANNPPGPRYVICNADESEVGAFKDRVLMEGDPFRILEGLLIACYAVGAKQGFVYIRGEHRFSYERLVQAVAALEETGWLGKNIGGSDFDCKISIRRGAGAYICGEETALMEALEGKRGFPRLRPPFPVTHGLWGKPTAINNVETLAKIPAILLYGGEWYTHLGTPQSAGTKLFSVSGSVTRPGVYEVPFGVPLRHLIDDLAGGLPQGREFQAILTGGAAGTFLKSEHLDTPISYEDFKPINGTIGAGTMIVFDDTVDLRNVLTNLSEFFAHESCGKCYPCQMGSERQTEILQRLEHGKGRPEDVETLLELAQVMSDTSICGLGQSASWATVDAIKRWPQLWYKLTNPLSRED